MKSKIIKLIIITALCTICYILGSLKPTTCVDIRTINGWDMEESEDSVKLILETDQHDYILEKVPYTAFVTDTYIE